MRVTNKMLSNSFLADMRTNLQNMQTVQQQMSSGKEIRRPSDDPFKVSRAMEINSEIDANKQYNENISDTINWLDTTDTAMSQAGNVLQRVRELLVSAGNAAYGSNERQSIKDEINQDIGQFAQILNTNFDGKYIFGGTRATTKPVDAIKDPTTGNSQLVYLKRDGTTVVPTNPMPPSDTEVNMISAKVSVEISQGVKMNYNVSASDVMYYTPSASGDTSSISQLFNNIVNHLDGKDSSGAVDPSASSKLTNDDLRGITDAINNLLKVRSEVGAKQNRMDSAKDKNTDETTNLTSILSKTEDIDITEKTMEYANMQTVYMASLQTSAKVIQPSLLDYLR
ncbi:MAG: flagellar hook-associated protein FlgL [Bacillota bacterium]|nr:flagellar hook-associated protein FlgL [Bacillota bacterium]